MANAETQQVDSIISNRRALLTLGGAALAGLAFAPRANAQAAGATFTDNDILNFALNLEYLEAQFYTLAASGQTIDQLGVGIGTGTAAATGGVATVITKAGGPTACKVTFQNSVIAAYATEIAAEERTHVSFLRTVLGANAVAQPQLDLFNSFNSLGVALGLPSFDPFASDVNFLLGSYIFEDVGVTAYHGGALLITDKVNVLPAAVGIHAVEATHSGMVRLSLVSIDSGGIVIPGYTAGSIMGLTLAQVTTAISNLRTKFAQTNATTPITDDYGTTPVAVPLNTSTDSTIMTGSTSYMAGQIFDIPLVAVTASATGVTPVVLGNGTPGIGYARTTGQVIGIVTAGGPTSASTGISTGGFFPAGLNGHFVTGVTTAA